MTRLWVLPYNCLDILLVLLGRHDHDHLPPFQQQLGTQLSVGHLPTSKTQCDLGLVTLFEESNQISQFDLIVTFFGTWSELDFLELGCLLFLSSGILLLVRLELETTMVHDLANWRRYIGRNFYQIEAGFGCRGDRFLNGNYPDLLTVCRYQPNFADFDLFVFPIDLFC